MGEAKALHRRLVGDDEEEDTQASTHTRTGSIDICSVNQAGLSSQMFAKASIAGLGQNRFCHGTSFSWGKILWQQDSRNTGSKLHGLAPCNSPLDIYPTRRAQNLGIFRWTSLSLTVFYMGFTSLPQQKSSRSQTCSKNRDFLASLWLWASVVWGKDYIFWTPRSGTEIGTSPWSWQIVPALNPTTLSMAVWLSRS